jgi:SAM-dependent methyltransferase
MLTESDKTTAGLLAEKWKVSPDIHPNDFIFHFVYDNPTFSTKEAAIQYYFNDGQNSAEQLAKILRDICKFGDPQAISVLEFASGYGCVTRHLRNVLPHARITSCDIHLAAANFIKEKLNSEAIVSNSVPEQLAVAETFDVVFALSFFSHMPKTTFGRWLKQLFSLVKPGGYLIFTTHGLVSSTIIPGVQFDDDGFWFQSSSEQKDLNVSEYGLTCTLPSYVFSLLHRNPLWNVRYFHEGYWWRHQDLYVVRLVEKDEIVSKQETRTDRIKRFLKNLMGRK